MEKIRTLYWEQGKLYLLDQNSLPEKIDYLCCHNWEEVAAAILRMSVRGAPAIGITAAFGVVLAAKTSALTGEDLSLNLPKAIQGLSATRPTAVNLFWALGRMRKRWEDLKPEKPEAVLAALEKEALAILSQEEAANHRLSQWGSSLVPPGANVLTHCNAGALATIGEGTALGVIRAAHRAGKIQMVYADETRPRLQGSRLTAWELTQSGIPVTVLCDNMAAYLMAKRRIDLVIVGSDRIAANGDVVNKIGTFGLAVAAQYFGLSFYVAAPTSTIDYTAANGSEITIEERPEDEVRYWGNHAAVPAEALVFNPAFDVTPAGLVTAIITERGILRPPFDNGLEMCHQIGSS